MSIANVSPQSVSLLSNVIVAKPENTTQSPPSNPAESTLQSNAEAVSPPPVKTVRQLLADQGNLRTLAIKLRAISGPSEPGARFIRNLHTHVLTPNPESSYVSKEGKPLTLIAFIKNLGVKPPRGPAEANALAQVLEQKAALLALGNFGGALSWPIPMSRNDQVRLASFLFSSDTGVPGLPLSRDGKRTLGYLLSGSSVTPSDLQDPPKALQKLLDSPKALALGKALQTFFGGAFSDASIYDYVLAAIHIGLDPDASVSRQRNREDDIDLMQPAFLGRSPSIVVEHLTRRLINYGRATTDSAKLGAYLLLSKESPQYLIKDIPDHVTIGSQAWTGLTIAAQTIEAERPGTVAGMTFAQVMSYPIGTEDRSPATEYAQTKALVDWGVANGVISRNADDSYMPQQIERVRTEFNQQLDARLSASKELNRAIPTRKEIALKELENRFGDLGPLFEAKVIGTDAHKGESSQIGLVGTHSMLDIAMMGIPNLRPLVSSDPRIPIKALNENLKFDASVAFEEQFAASIKRKKDAVSTTIRHLVTELTLQEPDSLRSGKISFYQEGSYTLGTDLWGTTPGRHKPELILKTELRGVAQAYAINFNAGTFKRTSLDRAKVQESRQGNVVVATKEFKPAGMPSELTHEQPVSNVPLNSFNSLRAHAIADAFVAHLELDDPAIKEQARGQTTLDKLQGGPKPLSELLLNLIPFRSAIVNFQNGNYGDGAFDLTLDVFGFLTAGLGTAGKLIKIGHSALSKGTKILKGAKVVGAATIGVLNPLSGLGDVAAGAVKLGDNGVRFLLAKGREAVNQLKGATGSYDLLKAASKELGVVATGTYKVGEQAFECGAVLSNGKWYAFHPITGRAYGPALPMFTAKSIAMGGEMQNFRVLDNGLGMSEDMTKRGLRLTLDAHGAMPPGATSAYMDVNGNLLTPSEILDVLKAHNVDLNKYTEIRLTMCHSAEGAGQSFAAQLAKLTHKPTEGFLGVMYGGGELEDVAARMFKNGGAKQREYIEQNINGQKKAVVKYQLSSVTPDGRGVYTGLPDYNPVRFDAAGVQMAAKPPRKAYTAEKVEVSTGERRHSDIDLSEYDLT